MARDRRLSSNYHFDPLTVRLITRSGALTTGSLAWLAYSAESNGHAVAWTVVTLAIVAIIVYTEREWFA